MNSYKNLQVMMGEKRVGTLAMTQNHLAAFEYDRDWLAYGFSISPLSLPLQEGVFLPKGYDPFEGLFGVFSDSLPDGWGRLLVDRFLSKNGISPAYDLTYSNSIGGEHATTVNGNGRNPGMEELLAVAERICFDRHKAKSIAEMVREMVNEDLSEWV